MYPPTNSPDNGAHPMLRIVVVDDSPFSTDALVTHMQLEGFDAVAYNDPLEALEALRADPPDLVLLDVMMPGMNGLEVLKTLRAQPSTAGVPVIMLTALDETDDIVRGLDLGANDYVTKPPQLEVLAARVRTQLHLKRLQDQRERDILELRRLSDIKDRFLQIAAHDLRTPVHNITLAVDLLNRHYQRTNCEIPQFDSIMRTMQNSLNVMRSIVNDFLDMQAIRSGSIELALQPVRLNDLVQSVLEQYEQYGRQKNIDLRVSLDPDLPPSLGDPDRLAQVIANLVSNAIKFSPPGSVVGIRTRQVMRRQLLEVADSGPGIPQEEMPLLFQEFARLSPQPTGGEKSSGVGLSIAKHLVEL
ncbi:MAG TPA: response regulator, partial [Aggregatilineales bacterium]|nr:response regulator [Aggregatilineales bacterium]